MEFAGSGWTCGGDWQREKSQSKKRHRIGARLEKAFPSPHPQKPSASETRMGTKMNDSQMFIWSQVGRKSEFLEL